MNLTTTHAYARNTRGKSVLAGGELPEPRHLPEEERNAAIELSSSLRRKLLQGVQRQDLYDLVRVICVLKLGKSGCVRRHCLSTGTVSVASVGRRRTWINGVFWI